jgi:hypothetical protein
MQNQENNSQVNSEKMLLMIQFQMLHKAINSNVGLAIGRMTLKMPARL